MAETRVLTARRLIDGTGSAPVNDAVVVVEGDRIAAVGDPMKGMWRRRPSLVPRFEQLGLEPPA